MKIYIYTLLAILSFLSCTKKISYLEQALTFANDNRSELEKVLNHYSNNPADSLKYKAAVFLIENIIYHHFYDGKALDTYFEYFEAYHLSDQPAHILYDSINKKHNHNGLTIHSFIRKRDIFTINASYLINNIEWAFRVWKEQPWSEHVLFDDFCEFILPYKIEDEKLPLWREELYHKYNPLLDSIRNLPEAKDPLVAAEFLLDIISKEPVRFTNSFGVGPHLGPQVIHWRIGTCSDFADIVTYIFRAVGIPCGTDFMMNRGNFNAPHIWNFVLDKDRKSYYTEFPYTKFNPTQKHRDPKGKVYRKTYSLNRELLKGMKRKQEYIHPKFVYPKFVDVTPIYTDTLTEKLTIPQEALFESYSQNDIIYLCVSLRDSWTPIDWTIPNKNDNIVFNNIEGNVVFGLATWNANHLKLISKPFLLKKGANEIVFFEDNNPYEPINILFKYHIDDEQFMSRMIGGVVEGSNHSEFKQVDTLYKITCAPTRLFTVVQLNSDKSYRYVRYIGPENSHCNISELALFEQNSDTACLKGRIIGTPGSFLDNGLHEFTNVFDNDPYTSFNYKHPNGGWAGLDLGAKKKIRKIIYAPRNRDNFVRKGDLYELLYWKEKGWVSVGYQEASSDSLLFEAPKGALLYLRNYTRGKDERIFEYKDGKQLFW